jgi:hypothetical protein
MPQKPTGFCLNCISAPLSFSSFDIMVNGNIGVYTFNALTGKEESHDRYWEHCSLTFAISSNNGKFLPEDNKFQPFSFLPGQVI